MNSTIQRATNPHRKHWLIKRTIRRRTRWLNYQKELTTSTFTWVQNNGKWERDPNDQANQAHQRYLNK